MKLPVFYKPEEYEKSQVYKAWRSAENVKRMVYVSRFVFAVSIISFVINIISRACMGRDILGVGDRSTSFMQGNFIYILLIGLYIIAYITIIRRNYSTQRVIRMRRLYERAYEIMVLAYVIDITLNSKELGFELAYTSFLIATIINIIVYDTTAFLHDAYILLSTLIFVGITFPKQYQFGLGISMILMAFVLCIINHYIREYNRSVYKQADDMYRQTTSLRKDIDIKNEMLDEREKRIIKMQDDVIVSLADLVENRDRDTGEHIKRTSMTVSILVEEAAKLEAYKNKITDDFANRIIKAAPMHDVGKIVIPDIVLQAPRRLTDEEFEIMKTHTFEGARIIGKIFAEIEAPEYIAVAENIARYHHEKWDGTGYPEGLSGEDIPLEARIMAIADVFDALVSVRCYKDSMSKEEAAQIIREGSGVQFDPVLTGIFINNIDRIE